MAITRRNFLESFAALAAIGCSGEIGNAVSPSVSRKSNVGGPPGVAGSGTGGGADHPAINSSGFAGMPNAAGAPGSTSSLVSADAGVAAATPAAQKFGVLRGKVITTPPQAAKNAVIYLVNAPLPKIVDARIDDVKLDFHPHVSVMTAGGMLTYVNNHPFPDSCFSTNNEKFDFGYVEAHGVRKRKFPSAGNYTLLCHVHPNEVGFLVVTPSSYFARADKQGEFVLADVPAGTYEIAAWAPRVKLETKSVVITEGDVTVDFELKR